MDVPIWVEMLNKLATPSIAAVSALYVYLQYKRAQRWKANELAANLLGKLETDPALSLACQALDWGVGPLLIPERYRPLFTRDAAGEYPGVMQHDTSVLQLALEPSLNDCTLKDPRGLVYRHCFIKLLSHLDNIFNLLKSGQVLKEDLSDLKYWLGELCDYRYAPASTKGTDVFQPALGAWGYTNVTKLAKELDVFECARKPEV